MVKQKLREGDWFAVPLRDDGYAAGLIARRKGPILLGYFFGPKRTGVPSLEDFAGLKPEDAVLVGMFGYLGLRDGHWPVIAHIPDWEREQWPIPVFIRHEELTGRTFRVFYADSDPNQVIREEQVPSGLLAEGPKDGLMGHGFVEIRLTRLLSSEWVPPTQQRPSEPRGTIRHFLNFPAEAAAHQVESIVASQGHTVEVRPAASGDTWLVLVTDNALRSPELLVSREREFDDLARAHGGEYDGYESAV